MNKNKKKKTQKKKKASNSIAIYFFFFLTLDELSVSPGGLKLPLNFVHSSEANLSWTEQVELLVADQQKLNTPHIKISRQLPPKI